MNTLAKFFIENSKLTVVMSLGLSIFGVMGLLKMNAESFPAVSLATATIITPYDGATAEDIEVKITKPIEDEIRGVSGLKDVRSTSQAGLSTIVVRVDMDDPKVDVGETMSEIQKAIDRTTGLPQDLNEAPKFTEIKSEEFPVVEIAVIGDNSNRRRDLISDLLKEEIEDHRSVKEVRLSGYAERAFEIYLDKDALIKAHISIDEVLRKIEARNTNTPGGALRTERAQRLVRVEGKIRDREELANIVVRSNFSGRSVLLKDVAEIIDGEEEITTKTKYNGREATLLIVTKKAGTDTISMVNDIKQKIELFGKRYKDYEFTIYSDEGVKVKNRVEVLESNALSGLVLVVIFLFFFLPGKVGLAASLSLPLAVLGTLGFMPSFDMNIDAITVLALVIALGMLVDNSVVISENFTRLRQSGLSAMDAATKSVADLWLPITATAFTTIAAFLPMLVTKGVMGEFIKWIPIVVTLALILSLLESFFFLPMRLNAFGKNVKEVVTKSDQDWFAKFEHTFERFMDKMVKYRYWVAVGFGGLVGFSFFMMGVANKFILFPAEQTEVYVARLEMPKGTRLEQTYEAVGKLSQRIQADFQKEFNHIVARAGVARMDISDPKSKEGNNIGMLTLYATDFAKYNIPYTEMLERLRKIQPKEFSQITYEELVNGPPVGNPIEVTFRSNDLTELNGLINSVKEKMQAIDGVKDLRVNDVVGDDEIFIDIDYVKADRLGLNVANIGSVVRTAVSGKRVSTVNLKNKDVDLIVRLAGKQRQTIPDLEKIQLTDPRGNLVPLGSFVSFRTQAGTPQIKRFDFKRSKTLIGSVDENKLTSIVANGKVSEYYDEFRAEYPGVSMVFGGAAESTKESMESLFQALILSLIGIFALLVFVFKSYIRPAIIMTTIPLGLLGFSVAFFFHQRPISFLALIGVIGLGGIIVNSGIVLISFIDQMKEEGKLSLHDILVKASGIRLRAVLVTSLTTISGLIPTAYGIGGSDSILIPMTMAMAWGLTSGTILTLVWVPCAYAILEDIESLIKTKILKRSPKQLDANQKMGIAG
jgi:multidrug efflux pump subunit AcrB